MMLTFAVSDASLLSPLGLAILAAGMVVGFVIARAFRRAGVIDDHRDGEPAGPA